MGRIHISANQNLYQYTGLHPLKLIDPDGKKPLAQFRFLKLSNVDLADQFTDKIVTRHGFQANSRSITTADQLLQELLGKNDNLISLEKRILFYRTS